MWATCPGVMKKCKVGEVGSFDRFNHHGGVMPGWPSESSMSNQRASKILLACIKSRKLTLKQLEAVRKCLSFLWELTGNKTKRDGNWPSVTANWDSLVRLKNLKPKKAMPAMRIPAPRDLKKAILKGWNKRRMPFLKWIILYGCFWDTMVCGARPNVDMDKIKKSRTHNFNWKKGWQYTEYVGGRSKLTGVKKGSRAWKAYTICLCKGKKHRRPKKGAWTFIDEDGNPSLGVEHLGFDPVCPLACKEMVWQCELAEDQPKRNYPNFLPRSKKYDARLGALNIGDPAQAAVDWLVAQGVGEFDHNAGRKALAHWCHHLDVPYKLSVHLHGDLPDVWFDNYQTLGLKTKNVKETHIREQSLDPQVATAALRKFAFFLGRGQVNEYKQPLSLVENQNNAILEKVYSKQAAKNLLMGLSAEGDKVKKEEESDSEVESDNTPWRPPKRAQGARKKRKRRRKSKAFPPVKQEPALPPPPPKKRKKIKRESPNVKIELARSIKIRLKPLGRGNKFKLLKWTLS